MRLNEPKIYLKILTPEGEMKISSKPVFKGLSFQRNTLFVDEKPFFGFGVEPHSLKVIFFGKENKKTGYSHENTYLFNAASEKIRGAHNYNYTESLVKKFLEIMNSHIEAAITAYSEGEEKIDLIINCSQIQDEVIKELKKEDKLVFHKKTKKQMEDEFFKPFENVKEAQAEKILRSLKPLRETATRNNKLASRVDEKLEKLARSLAGKSSRY